MPKLKRRPYRIHIVGPAWMSGGTEQHTQTLQRFFDPTRVRIDCVHVTTSQYFDQATAEETSLTIRQTPPEELAAATANADCILHWGIESDLYLKPSRSQARIAIAHGSSHWGCRMLEGSQQTTDLTICVSQHVADSYDLIMKHDVIRNGIDTSRLTNTRSARTSRAELGVTDETFVVGYVGRLAPEKSVDQLIRAIDLTGYPTQLVICGTGNEHQKLLGLSLESECATTQFTYRSIFMGDIYQSLDCFVMPSEHEGFCLAAAEAMWCGLPLIMRRTGLAATDIIDGFDGHLYDGSDQQLADKIDMVRKLQRFPNHMGYRAHEKADELYHGLRMANEYTTAIEALIESKPDHKMSRHIPY